MKLLKNPHLWSALGGGTFNAGLWDARNVMSDNTGWRSIPFIGTFADIAEGKMSKGRAANTLVNSIIGAGAGSMGSLAGKAFSRGEHSLGGSLGGIGTGAIFATPAKDMALAITNAVDKNKNAPTDLVQQIKEQAGREAKNNKLQNWLLGGALGLGAGGLLYSMLKKDKPEKAKMLVKLPGDPKDPNSDVTVEVPVSAGRIKPEIMRGIRRSIRKQTARNVISQQRKRDPRTGKLIPYTEWRKKYGESELPLRKSASGREWAEGLGSLLAPAIGAAAAGYGVHKYTGGDLKKALIAGAGASIIPMLFGSLFGHAAGKRTTEQQLDHDAGAPLLEYILPGHAQFQSARRARVSSQEGMEDEDELDTDDDLDYEDELDKYAAQQSMSPMPASPPPASASTPVNPPGGGVIGARPDMLAGASNVTAETNKSPGTATNTSKHLRQAADNLSSWLKQYNVRKG